MPGEGVASCCALLRRRTRVMDKSTQSCGPGGTPSVSESEIESQSYEPEATANYISLGQDSETEPAAYMGFFDQGDFVEVLQNHPDYYH